LLKCIRDLIRIGEEATIYLLRNSSIFLPSKNVLFINKGCYYQICGVAIDKRVGNTLEPTVKDPLAVGLKRSMSTNSIPAKRQKVGMIPWSHILYGKPVYSEDGKIIVSLPPKHMLHSCSPQDLLISVFQEKPKKVHWRVKQAIPLIKRFIKNHQNCSYQALLDYYCPLTPTSRISEDSNILELDTPHHQIQGFIKAVLKRVIPVDFFGTKSNLEQFLKSKLVSHRYLLVIDS
jgi:hypothetical protein